MSNYAANEAVERMAAGGHRRENRASPTAAIAHFLRCFLRMNAVEVSIDGEPIGVYVPPDGGRFTAMIGNIPRTYMRAHIIAGNDSEDWQWQLPDVQPGQTICFRLVEAAPGGGVPPQFVRPRDPRDVVRCEREGKKLYARARKEMDARKRK